jgi:hypothetical protein
MSERTREKKSAKPQQPAKLHEISVGRRFAQPYAKARLLFDHPTLTANGTSWANMTCRGFSNLESRFRLNPGEQRSTRPSSSVFMSANLKGSNFDRRY